MYVEIKVLVTLFVNHVFDFWAKRRAVFLIRETDWIRLSMFRGLTLSWFNLYMQVEIQANVAPHVYKKFELCALHWTKFFFFFFWVNKPNLNSCSVPELLSKSDSSAFKNVAPIRWWIYRSLSFFPVCTVSLWTIMPSYLPRDDLHVPDLKICAWENLSACGRRKLICITIDEIWDPLIHYCDWLLASRPFILSFSPKLKFSLRYFYKPLIC